VILPLIFYSVDLLVARFRKHPPTTRFKGLLLASIITSATHPLLDWTNSYGIRFFLPWNQKWSYGDLVFIVDPYLWLILGGAAFLLTARTRFLRFSWIGIGAVLTYLIVASPRRGALPNQPLFAVLWIVALVVLIALSIKDARAHWRERIAFVAFALVLSYWTFLGFTHSRALVRGNEEASAIAAANGETVTRLATMPRLANPFHWDCVFETDRATYRFELGLLGATNENTPLRYAKPGPELAQVMSEVLQQRPAKIFLNFARFPVMQLADPNCTARTLVQLADLRYTEPGSSRGTFSLELPVDCPSGLQGR
jgi:inner membrane protein